MFCFAGVRTYMHLEVSFSFGVKSFLTSSAVDVFVCTPWVYVRGSVGLFIVDLKNLMFPSE